MSGSSDWESGSDEDPALESGFEPDQDEEVRGPDQDRAGRLKKSPSAFRTISEVADDLHIPQHVLRFWETRFPQVKPLKRGGGRRYYRPDDIALLRRISDLLYIQGYTIKGVQRLLREGDGTLSGDLPPPDVADRGDELEPVPTVIDEIASPPTEPHSMAEDLWIPTPPAPPHAETEALQGEVLRLRQVLQMVLHELETLRSHLPGQTSIDA